MTLDELPCMKILVKEGRFSHRDFDPSKDTNVSGKFVVFEGPEDDVYVLAMEPPVPEFGHGNIRYEFFQPETFPGLQQLEEYSIIGGGDFALDISTLVLSGESTKFGKYPQDKTEPVVREYVDRFLPDNEVQYE